MFVKTLKIVEATALLSAISATGAAAADLTNEIYETGTISVTVNLSGVKIADARYIFQSKSVNNIAV